MDGILILWAVVFALILSLLYYAVYLEEKDKVEARQNRDARYARLRNERKKS